LHNKGGVIKPIRVTILRQNVNDKQDLYLRFAISRMTMKEVLYQFLKATHEMGHTDITIYDISDIVLPTDDNIKAERIVTALLAHPDISNPKKRLAIAYMYWTEWTHFYIKRKTND